MSNQADQDNLAEEMTARAPSGDYSKIAWETLSSLDRLCQSRTFIMLIYYSIFVIFRCPHAFTRGPVCTCTFGPRTVTQRDVIYYCLGGVDY